MATQAGGFASGYMQAGEYQTQQQQGQDQHQMAMQSLAKGNIELASAQQQLDAMHAAQLELAHMHQGGGAGGGGGTGAGGQAVSGVAGQAYKSSELAFAAGDVYSKYGLFQQGAEFAEKGAKLAEAGSALEVHQAEQSTKMWQHVGSVLETVHENSPSAQQDWDNARMTFPHMFPEEAKHPEVQKFLKMSFKELGPQGLQMLKDASLSAQQQAEQQKTKAESKHIAAQTRWDDAGVLLRQSETREHNARATAIEKTGGKPPTGSEIKDADSLIEADYPGKDPKGYHLYSSEIAERAKQLIRADVDKDTAYKQAYEEVKKGGRLDNLPDKPSKKEQQASEVRGELVDDIDDLIRQIDENPGMLTGLSGRAGEVMEWGKTFSGIGDQATPATTFGEGMHALMLRVPKALTGSGKSAKDERALVGDIANVRKMMTSDATGRAKLSELRDIFARMQGKTITGKGDKVNPHGAVVREGTFNSKKVVQYADGTVDYPEGK